MDAHTHNGSLRQFKCIMLYLLLFLFQLVLAVDDNRYVGVPTSQGVIIGQLTKSRYGTMTIFYGVPYAMVDETNKFGESLPIKNFTTLQAWNIPDSCPHSNGGGVLQCLTLNIVIPIIKSKDGLTPVLIWFFGGFMMNPNNYDGRHIANHGIIVVTVNYRLGPYGFFCLEDIKNQGLRDQKKAIKWVKKHIEAFGGDPKRITIGGQSYGAGAVDFHLYDKEQDFDKAIIQSGSRFAKGITSKKDNNAPIKIAKHFGSKVSTTREALEFLNGIDPGKVMTSTKLLGIKFGVCKDKVNYEDHIQNKPIIIGYNSKEDLATYALQSKEYYQDLGAIFSDYLSEMFTLDKLTLTAFCNIVKKFYLGSTKITPESIMGLVDFSSDTKINFAVERSVKKYLQANATKVYKYLFSYTGRSPFQGIRGIGASHAEELPYLFDKDSDSYSAEQTVIRNKMTEMWANFVKYGKPTLSQEHNNHGKRLWQPTNLEQRYYLNIDKEIFLGEHLLHQRLTFWELLKSFYKYILKDRVIHEEDEDTLLSTLQNSAAHEKSNLKDKDLDKPKKNAAMSNLKDKDCAKPKKNMAMLSVIKNPDLNILFDKYRSNSPYRRNESNTEDPLLSLINNDDLIVTPNQNEVFLKLVKFLVSERNKENTHIKTKNVGITDNIMHKSENKLPATIRQEPNTTPISKMKIISEETEQANENERDPIRKEMLRLINMINNINN